VARLLIQLKLRLLRNALRSTTAARISFVSSTILAGVLAIGAFLILAGLRGNAASVDLTTVIFTLFGFGWLILPIFAFGLDDTLDPATLALYPLRTRPLAVGLLAASSAGAWPAANVLGLLGVTIGLASGGPGVLVAVVAVLLQVFFCITLARLVTTGMAGLLRSRRGKDLAAFLIIPMFALYEFFTQAVPKAAGDGTITAASFAGVDSWLRWLPPGLAAHAIQDASQGRPGTALLRLALLAAVIVVLGWLWIRSLGRALVTADTSTQASRVRGPGGRSGLVGRASRALPFGRYGVRGTVAARFWIYQRRDPASLIAWGAIAVIMAAVSIRALLGPGGHPAFLLFSAVLGAGFVGVYHANSAGLDGPPFVFEALALTGRRELRAYFSGQDIALGAIAVPLLAAVCFGLASVAGRPGNAFPAIAVALAGVGAALGVSNVFSVLMPYPMDKRAGNPTRQPAQGYGSYGFFGLLGNVGGAAVAAAPVIVAAVLTNGDPAAVRVPVLLACAAAYGFALAWAGVRIAARAAEDRLPELCQVAMRSKL
jgi:ABC-2 type transport system permease protein